MAADFNFTDFTNSYASPTLAAFPDALTTLQPLQPGPTDVYAPPTLAQQTPYVHSAPQTGDKRKSESLPSPNRPLSFEDVSRLAAEEDKRRRNTAASARFRIKKKQREQALEKSAKEMIEKVTMLEGRIQQLETENKWLKNLLTEKNGGNEDIAVLLKEFNNNAENPIDETSLTDVKSES
jgi:Basic region leucine zipper